ncbi:ribosome silencing factor [Oligella ureolytica]
MLNMPLEDMQRLVIDALEDAKAQDIKVFDTTGLTSLFDRVIIVSGTSNRQTRSLARSVYDAVREQKLDVLSVEGEDTGEWIVLDLADIVVHCMQPAIRQYYNLEAIWGEKPVEVDLLPQSRLVPQINQGFDPIQPYPEED